MQDFIKTLTTGLNGQILLWFLVGIVFVYIPFMLVYLKRRKEKAEIFEYENNDFVKVYLKFDFTGTLTVYSINGEKPVCFYEKTKQGFYLLPGKHTIGVQYHWAKVDKLSVTGYNNFNVEPLELTVTVEKDKTYLLGYTIEDDKYIFELE